MASDLRHRRAPAPAEGGDEGASSAATAGGAAAASGKEGAEERTTGKRDALGWLEWGRGWMAIVGEFLFQRIAASHLANPLELPPLDGVSIVVTGATSGIGLEIARSPPSVTLPFAVSSSSCCCWIFSVRPLRFACFRVVAAYGSSFDLNGW
jgi:hypothetical protein